MNEGKLFQKRKENFVCEKCQTNIKGDGYTDHCPNCLWSKHVDINPGDREERCRGLMEPVGVQVKTEGYILYYECVICRKKRKVKANKNDNLEKVMKLVGKILI